MIPEHDIQAVVALRDVYGITPREAQALLLFLRGSNHITPDRIRDVYCDRPRLGHEGARDWAKRVRARSGGRIRIRHERGMGYELAPETLREVRAIVREARQ